MKRDGDDDRSCNRNDVDDEDYPQGPQQHLAFWTLTANADRVPRAVLRSASSVSPQFTVSPPPSLTGVPVAHDDLPPRPASKRQG